MKQLNYWKFLTPVWIILSLILVGTFGYHLIDGYGFFNAFYMTVITIATVGYGEIEPLSTSGRLFTAFLIIFSFGTFAYAIGLFTKYIVEGDIRQFLLYNKFNRMAEKLTGHVIICGYGRNGHQAASVLHKHNKQFIVIEKSNNGSYLGLYKDLVLEGDATSDELLIRAGIHRAKALITTLPNDADNLFICLSARNLNPTLTIISRASEDSSDAKLRIAGANNVIMPDKIGGAHMASLIMKPDVIEFLDFVTGQGGESINLEEFSYENLPDNLKGKTLKELEIRNTTGANIVGFKNAQGKFLVNPGPDTVLIPNAKVFVLGTPEQISRLRQMLNVNA